MPDTTESFFAASLPGLFTIWIHNDKVEIRDAEHLRGKGAVEVRELIREELKEPNAAVCAIGAAGEHRNFLASIEQGRSSSSPLGGNCVMGDKNIHGIACVEP